MTGIKNTNAQALPQVDCMQISGWRSSIFQSSPVSKVQPRLRTIDVDNFGVLDASLLLTMSIYLAFTIYVTASRNHLRDAFTIYVTHL